MNEFFSQFMTAYSKFGFNAEKMRLKNEHKIGFLNPDNETATYSVEPVNISNLKLSGQQK